MTFYQKLERKLGRHAVPKLMQYICVMYVVGFFIMNLNPLFYWFFLSMDPSKVMHGQIWRIITFLFYPPSGSLLWMLLATFVYYSLGMTLQQVWGDFKYNYFFFQGVLLLVAATLLFYVVTGISLVVFPIYMSFSIFLAYALTFPEATFLFYFIIPIKAKWLAMIEVVIYCFYFLSGSMADKLMIGAALLNVFLFFYLTENRGRRKITKIKDYL